MMRPMRYRFYVLSLASVSYPSLSSAAAAGILFCNSIAESNPGGRRGGSRDSAGQKDRSEVAEEADGKEGGDEGDEKCCCHSHFPRERRSRRRRGEKKGANVL